METSMYWSIDLLMIHESTKNQYQKPIDDPIILWKPVFIDDPCIIHKQKPKKSVPCLGPGPPGPGWSRTPGLGRGNKITYLSLSLESWKPASAKNLKQGKT